MAYLLDVVPVLPADHLMFPGAAVALAELRVQRYRLVGDPDSLAAAAETATVACRTIRPDDPARGASLPMMLGVLVESAVVLGTPSPEEVLLIALNRADRDAALVSASGTWTSGGWCQRQSAVTRHSSRPGRWGPDDEDVAADEVLLWDALVSRGPPGLLRGTRRDRLRGRHDTAETDPLVRLVRSITGGVWRLEEFLKDNSNRPAQLGALDGRRIGLQHSGSAAGAWTGALGLDARRRRA